MKKLTLLVTLFLFLNPSFSQQSLDSLRLVLPVGINGDENVLKIQLNKEKTILKIQTDKQDVFYEISSRKQLPTDLVSFKLKYTAKELKLNLIEPSYNATDISDNLSLDNGFTQTYDSVSFCKSLCVLRKGEQLTLKNKEDKICSQLQLLGLGNFRLYQCIYLKCEEFYFIIPWNYGTIQNSIIAINSKNQSMSEFSGMLLQTTSISIGPSQSISVQTNDAGDFTEHQGSGEISIVIINPLTKIPLERYGCWNPNYFNDSLLPFYSSDYKYLITPIQKTDSEVNIIVNDSNGVMLFSHLMSLDVFKEINEIHVNKKRSNCVISSSGSIIQTFDIYQKKIIEIGRFPVHEFCKLEQLANGDLIVFNSYEWAAWDPSELYLINDYKSLTKIKIANYQGLYGYGIYNDHSVIMPDSGKVITFDILSQQKNIILAEGAVEDIFAYDQIYSALLYYQESNREIQIYSVKEKKIVYYLYPLLYQNWLVKLPNSPYYMCSKDASKMLHYVTPSLKVIGFEQLDPVYNRPDIVLDSIGKYFGNSDGGMIEEYRKSWEKRIDHLGLDKEQLGKGEISVPNAEIVGADLIASENKDGKLDIKVAANDPKYPLRRFNVYVNEVPLYGSAGISIAHLKKQVWDTTVSVPLSIGENKIQVSVMNELGLENFKYPSYVRFVPQADNNIPGKTYFIGIGVDKFKDTCYNLNYCVKDVKDLSEAIGKDQKNVQVILLTNKMVTRESILKLKELLQNTNVNDKVIISCSSHGLLDSMKRFYLATEDVDFENPSERGIKYEELEALLDSIPARQKLLLLDACNSGENEIEQGATLANKPKSNCEKKNGIKGNGRSNVKRNNEDFMKMNELFVNVRNNTGSLIISAAGGQQSALEGDVVKVDGKSIKNGAFTYCVLEYLKMHEGDKEALTVIQLKKYVEKRVEEITNGKQQPTSRQETMEIDWGLR